MPFRAKTEQCQLQMHSCSNVPTSNTDLICSGGDKRPRTKTRKAFEALAPTRKYQVY